MTMILAAMLAASSLLASAQTRLAWTWTLYEGDTVTLANEVPDTTRLESTFECEPGTSVTRLTLYGGAPSANGYTRVTSGQSTATVAVSEGARGAGVMTLRTDHPVFSAFAANGRLTVMDSDIGVVVVVPPDHLAKLRRFAELCAG